MKRNDAIGLFDSGVGGSSIWREINHLLPNENTIYLSDSRNAPYGHKTPKEITTLSIKNTEYVRVYNRTQAEESSPSYYIPAGTLSLSL